MSRPALVRIEEAAACLGVPKQSLRRAAEAHGLLIYMGRAVRIDPNCYEELIQACRAKPQVPAFTSAPTPEFTSSATLDVPTVQPALDIARMLKKPSRPTSSGKALSPAPVTRIGSP